MDNGYNYLQATFLLQHIILNNYWIFKANSIINS